MKLAWQKRNYLRSAHMLVLLKNLSLFVIRNRVGETSKIKKNELSVNSGALIYRTNLLAMAWVFSYYR
jgi:hypothetical protein